MFFPCGRENAPILAEVESVKLVVFFDGAQTLACIAWKQTDKNIPEEAHTVSNISKDGGYQEIS